MRRWYDDYGNYYEVRNADGTLDYDDLPDERNPLYGYSIDPPQKGNINIEDYFKGFEMSYD